ncbi:S8 family serine peptidase [Solirubrobacter phytolaccae]|uniref:S8 family serine peptidase n=1 Tax=Solirubrobacter phytolaccae TaxID=1404360 RepID=A0A9X3NBA9_9ACTN|nr:S8 family serine peptidase [Solirubrobacter phytolaccae]MDA0181612.1 S8 family serine peptidase [Solirubrobacter phytolaccae]
MSQAFSRRMRPALVTGLAALTALVSVERAQAATTSVIVMQEAGVSAESAVRAAGGQVEHRLPTIDAFTATVPAEALAPLRAEPGVRAVVVDTPLRLSEADGADADAGVRMSLVRQAVGAVDTATGAGVGVALIDSGVTAVPGLATSNVVVGPDFSSEARDPDLARRDGFGHGTHLAGVIAGQDAATGFAGLAPGARLVSVKVADHEGATALSSVLAGIDWTVRNAQRPELGIRVLNLAFGADTPGNYRVDPLAAAVEVAWQRGIVVVTSAGNGGPTTTALDSPAFDPYVIAVGADDTLDTPAPADDRIADFSSRGSAQRAPDVIAPGVGIVSLRVPGGVLDEAFPQARIGETSFRGSGTSQAAAVVTGAVARLLQVRPQLKPDEIKAVLKASATPLAGVDPRLQGAGLINLQTAVGAPAVNADQRWPRSLGGFFAGRIGVQFAVENDRPNGGRWRASRWTASRWTASRWTASRWTASRWTASRWTASRWTASRWTTSLWG